VKFKNEKDTAEGQEARILVLTDKKGTTLDVRAYVDGKPEMIFSINESGDDEDGWPCVGMSRNKALKLAWAIIKELTDWETAS
jgi:hypothetical protein